MVAVLKADDSGIERAAAVIRAGGLVAFPTETVYGLGADALNPTAVAKVFEAKGRPRFDPLIVHVADPAAAKTLVASWPEAAQRLAEAFWPGPLTLVLPKAAGPDNADPIVPDLVTSGLPNVAVRVPRHPVARALIEAAGTPIAAPSANRFGAVSPTRAEHVADEFSNEPLVEMVLDGGPCQTGVESTVLSLVGERPVLLRAGGTPVEEIEAVIGSGVATNPQAAGEAEARKGMASPGMLERHYAPRTPMRVVDDGWPMADVPNPARVGLLCFTAAPATIAHPPAAVEVLSPGGDLREAAANLFAAMRRLDATGVDLILAERVPDRGLGRAINDRLMRAARR